MSKRLVIALGGNALGKTPQEQLDLVKGTASTIVDLVEEGYDVVIGHGNGPRHAVPRVRRHDAGLHRLSPAAGR